MKTIFYFITTLLILSCGDSNLSKIQEVKISSKKAELHFNYFSILNNDTIGLNFYEDYLIFYVNNIEYEYDCKLTEMNYYTYNLMENNIIRGRLLKKENDLDTEFEIWLDCFSGAIDSLCNRTLIFKELVIQ